MGPTTRLSVETNKVAPGLSWTDDALIKITDSLSKEFDLPPSAPGGFVAYRKCLVTSLFYKFFVTVQSKLADLGILRNSKIDQSAIGEIQTLPTEAIQGELKIAYTPFLRWTYFCTTNTVWYFFGQANLYSLCSPGNQYLRKLKRVNFFRLKRSKSTMQK